MCTRLSLLILFLSILPSPTGLSFTCVYKCGPTFLLVLFLNFYFVNDGTLLQTNDKSSFIKYIYQHKPINVHNAQGNVSGLFLPLQDKNHTHGLIQKVMKTYVRYVSARNPNYRNAQKSPVRIMLDSQMGERRDKSSVRCDNILR